jgi:L-alanine-DL-glutamate epimerase-like enolase superfamily enzyme
VEGIIDPPFALDENGCLPVPDKPGLGVDIDRERLKAMEEAGFSSPTWTWEELRQHEA